MTNDPNELRADIERTRADLGYDVDALADKVTPSKMVQRQTSRARQSIRSVKDRVMGAASDARDSAGESIAHAPQVVAQKAQGNPMAVGLIAFGAGLLVASLIPASEKEKELAGTIKEKAEPLTDEVADVAKEMAGNLKEPAQEAATAVKDAATDAGDTVKQETTSAASDVQDKAKGTMGSGGPSSSGGTTTPPL
ncbi:DUF3618 domain-containing protein [Salinibacterium sp. ZJ450]|uniref:DUF3618 domain-containing protein n=1 Tax=Salinibacterium sp. ZJ450 TaxID=2708338 RepID=UPI00141F1D00|nr:DUF3618 domain-containing protein [Salinibacterium sp. ZJ450]